MRQMEVESKPPPTSTGGIIFLIHVVTHMTGFSQQDLSGADMNEGFKMLAWLGFKPFVLKFLVKINFTYTFLNSFNGDLQMKAINDNTGKDIHFLN